jgi:pimeloyl-ACP methyl ester carboxylesterase
MIAKAGIPVFQVLGDADEVVPVEENGYVLRERFKTAGGSYREIIKPGALHHPHGLDDPTAVVEFIAAERMRPAALSDFGPSPRAKRQP